MREEEFRTGFLFTLFIIIIVVAFPTGFLSETYIKTKIPPKNRTEHSRILSAGLLGYLMGQVKTSQDLSSHS